MRKFRTLTDPGEVEGIEPGGELNGRELLDSKPISAVVKAPREQLGPLDQMYAEIRARQQLALDQAHEESADEQFDFDLPDEVDEFLSRYEEHPVDELLGVALADPRVQEALRASLEGKYGPRHALALEEYGKERGNLPTVAPSKPAADPPKRGEPPAAQPTPAEVEKKS